MIPTTDRSNNAVLLAGDIPNCSDLPVTRLAYPDGSLAVQSCWRASWRERLQVLFTGRVYLLVFGVTQPPVAVETHSDAKPQAADVTAEIKQRIADATQARVQALRN